MSRALLIDDEPPACDALRALLAEHPHVSITGVAGTMTEARALLAQPGYELVFLDIQLRGGTGFDLVPLVRPGARIIFVTAFDEHAIRAFEINALDYLLKPVAPDRLARALARVVAPAAANEPTATPRLNPEDRVLLKLGAGTERFVRIADIRCISSEENYTSVTVGPAHEHLLVRRTMKVWEEQLPADQFVRVHRQMIVNVGHVRSLTRVTDAVFAVSLDGLPSPVQASHRYVADLRARMVAR